MCDDALQVITPRNYYSDLSNATGGSHLDVGMVEQVCPIGTYDLEFNLCL